VDAEGGTILDRVARSWGKAPVLHTGPPFAGFPEPLELAQRIAAEYPRFHDGLVALLSSSDKRVAGYALLTLRPMGSPVLPNLPEELLSGEDQVLIARGCFLNSLDLEFFGRHRRDGAEG
jgi:hypothetical protein